MDIYEFIKLNIKNEKSFSNCHDLFNADISKLSLADRNIFIIIRDISSIFLSIDIDKFEIIPMWKSADNKSTFSKNDFTEEIIKQINLLQVEKLPLNIQVKINELFYDFEKNYKNANSLLTAYNKMLDVEINKENWLNLKDVFIRILQILKEQNRNIRNELVYQKLMLCIDTFYNLKLYFISIIFIKIYVTYIKDYDCAIKYIDKIIAIKSDDISDSYDILKAYDEKYEIQKLMKSSDNDIEITEINKADKCLEISNVMKWDNAPDLQRIENLLSVASIIYTKYKKKYQEKLNSINNTIIEVRKKLFNLSPKIITELNFDEIDKYINDNFSGLSLDEAIVCLTLYVGFYDTKYLEEHTVDIYSKNIFTALSGLCLYDSRSGLITCKFNPLKIENMKESEDFEKYVNREYINIIDRVGLQFVSRILLYIKNNYKFSINSFDFLVENNANIPAGKEKIIKKGILAFFNGDNDVALYVLVPQIEEMLRMIIENAGGSIIDNKIDEKDGSTIFITLTKVLKNEFLNETIEEDVIKAFKCILDSKSGLNLRNLLLHGLMYDNETYSGGAIYLIVLIIKWITFGSYNCRKITANLNNKFPKSKIPENLFKSKIITNIS